VNGESYKENLPSSDPSVKKFEYVKPKADYDEYNEKKQSDPV